MTPVWHEDTDTINHINFVSNSLHDITDELYEDLMERDHDKAMEKAQDMIVILSDLIKSLTEEI
jgi:hypothetical protein